MSFRFRNRKWPAAGPKFKRALQTWLSWIESIPLSCAKCHGTALPSFQSSATVIRQPPCVMHTIKCHWYTQRWQHLCFHKTCVIKDFISRCSHYPQYLTVFFMQEKYRRRYPQQQRSFDKKVNINYIITTLSLPLMYRSFTQFEASIVAKHKPIFQSKKKHVQFTKLYLQSGKVYFQSRTE